MTVAVAYSVPQAMGGLGDWQVRMAEQIEAKHGFRMSNIGRELSGNRFVVRVETTLPSEVVENMRADIEEYLPPTASHVETREVE